MNKTEIAALRKLTPEQLVESFVLEAKLSDPAMPLSVAEMNERGSRSRACAAEIIARGGSASLIALLDAPDNWIANCAAEALVVHHETKEIALATLDRIADECSGNASSSADITRNMIRYGNPLGAEWVRRS